jgi:UrcA family protein
MNTMTTTRSLHTVIAAMLVGVSTLSLGSLAAAADTFAPLQVTVKFGDLDVSHPQGAAVLYGRIHAAAKDVCSPLDRGSVLDKMEFASCVQKALADAVTAVNAPALSAVYNAKMNKALPLRVASVQNR